MWLLGHRVESPLFRQFEKFREREARARFHTGLISGSLKAELES